MTNPLLADLKNRIEHHSIKWQINYLKYDIDRIQKLLQMTESTTHPDTWQLHTLGTWQLDLSTRQCLLAELERA